MTDGYGAAREAAYEKTERQARVNRPIDEDKRPSHALGMAMSILNRLYSQGEILETLDSRLRSEPKDQTGKGMASPSTLLDILDQIMDKVDSNNNLANEIARKIGN